MTFTLRPINVPDDYRRVAELHTMINYTPATAEGLAASDKAVPESTIRQQLVAVEPSGLIIAFGYVQHLTFYMPGRFSATVLTDPAYRRQGAGSALAEALEGFARQHGATNCAAYVQENHPDAVLFAEKRGYRQTRHFFESELDLTAFNEANFTGAVRAAEETGIRFCSLADRPGEASERAMYAVDAEAARDNPGEDIGEFPPFEDWRQLMTRRQGQRPEYILFASDGDRVVGFSTMHPLSAPGLLHVGFTGVLREYRGRGIALALKALAAATARQFGFTRIRTENDSRNAPMLAVNRKVGYKPLPGTYELIKEWAP